MSKIAFEIKTMEFVFVLETINTKEIINKVRKKAILLECSYMFLAEGYITNFDLFNYSNFRNIISFILIVIFVN